MKLIAQFQEKFDFDLMMAALKGEYKGQERLLQKLKTKNGVIAGQIRVIREQIKVNAKAAEESGPVDVEQLQLENTNHYLELGEKNRRIVELRKQMSATKFAKQKETDKLKVITYDELKMLIMLINIVPILLEIGRKKL